MAIKIVNMIPLSMSGETNQDSEPNLAVNPANPLQIAGSAFTPNPGGSGNAPIYVSIDGGDTWTLNSIVPSAGSIGTSDITLRFAGTSSRLFTTILDGSTAAFEVHRSTDFTSPALMTQLEGRADEDQPYVQAATVLGGAGAGSDRVYIGVNDFNAGSKTATIEMTLDGGAGAPVFSSVRLEKRSNAGQDGPQVRPAVHADGTVYAAFYRWISTSGSGSTLKITNAELIVCRDDHWGTGAAPFTALTDPSDSLSGRRVATGLSFPFNVSGVNANGQERWGGDISICVDPRDSGTVFVAYSTLVGTVYTLQVRRSTDRGVTWSALLLSLPNAKNPALAVNSLGRLALVNQQFTGSGATQRWETHWRDSADNGATWSDTMLCSALAQTPLRSFSPYIGDYLHMMAVGKDFYGIFSANNTPDLANFPQGVVYQRQHDFATKKLFALDGVTVVPPSIDPFFFKVTALEAATGSDFYVRDWTTSAADHDGGLEPSTHPVFYATSDVWNQRSAAAPSFIADVPQNEDPQNDATNRAFVRVSRNQPGAAETVNVEFLVAEFGTGSPYASVATTSVVFAASDLSKVVSAPWTLPATSSTHLCLGVQISTATDPFVAPGLNGHTPGWPTTDLLVINDNNKAQRNMSVHYGLAGFGAPVYAIIRNASTKARDFTLRIAADDSAGKALGNPLIAAEGLPEKSPLKPGSTVVVPGMAPGESRWLALEVPAIKQKTGGAAAVDMLELVDGKPVNGLRFMQTAATEAKALRELLLCNASVFGRVAALHRIAGADEVVKATRAALKPKTVTATAYRKLMVAAAGALSTTVKAWLDGGPRDRGLGIDVALKALAKAGSAKTTGKLFAAHAALLNKLDVALTLGHLSDKG